MATLESLSSGERAQICYIEGDFELKQRLMDMGLIVGEELEVKQVAPFGDPIQVAVKDCSITLRRNEAESIGVIRRNNPSADGKNFQAQRKVVAVVGAPNSGKSSLVNSITNSHLSVANWPGVTVGKSEVQLEYLGRFYRVVDLPGTSNLSPESPKQVIVRDFVVNQRPDLIVNVIDTTNLEGSLLLTLQLLELGLPMVIVLNMYDELTKKGHSVDVELLQEMFGVKVVTTTAVGKSPLFQLKKEISEGTSDPDYHRPKKLTYRPSVETYIRSVEDVINCNHSHLVKKYPIRWLAIKLLEEDPMVQKIVPINLSEIISTPELLHLEEIHNTSIKQLVQDSRHSLATGIVREVLAKPTLKRRDFSERVDDIVLHRFFSVPLFLYSMWVMFTLTFDISIPFVNWLDSLRIGPIREWAIYWSDSMGASALMTSLISEGIVNGVGFVAIFLPIIATLMFFISIMESSGLMARAAFIMDRAMHSIGLHGNSFIPLLLGFGCNVPSIYATRGLASKTERKLTTLLIPLMSCGARLPIYALMIGVFFQDYAGTMLWGLYSFGMLLSILLGIIFRKFIFKEAPSATILELPPYRIPSLRDLLIHTWEKVRHFVIKAGTLILAASIIVWFALHLPLGVKDQRHSVLGEISAAIAPVFKPLGFGSWQAASSIITGVMAKEVVIGTMEIINGGEQKTITEASAPKVAPSLKQTALFAGRGFLLAVKEVGYNFAAMAYITDKTAYKERSISGLRVFVRQTFTPLSAISFMVFILIYMPCMATATAIKHEFGRWNLFIFSVFHSLTLAWVTSFCIYQVGRLLGFS
ncbi:MAG: ferrous iron transport protein B [Bdellovibrionales bacterium]|jgi:ferrous iron transport protein B|nr:ferrous iron transport protein B [Bdellovibrionales bacterium]MBT3525965.1 ferrous iron transport protein B [Bdellovibrionales bacterium]MBT7765752.1 ferrous iron transport protein B [Bdellovibrionales bacterium]